MTAKRDVASTIEDLEFLDESGVGAIEAAQRSGFASANAMSLWLREHDANDLWQSLRARDPSGADPRKPTPATVTSMARDSIASILDAASKSKAARTRTRAEKARALIDELRVTVAQEREDEQRAAEARKEIERLERELAAAKAKLRGTGGKASIDVGSSVSAAELRAWAKANGVECPPMGRVPAAVREAWEAAHENTKAVSA